MTAESLNQPNKQIETALLPSPAQEDKVGDFLLAHWTNFITVSLGIIVFAAISVPFLSYFGFDAIAKPIFNVLHLMCAQIPSHSFYAFGHQLGLCARNFSIYASMFLVSFIFNASKRRMPGIPWWLFGLMVLPMAWDGFSQMFGLRESDWILRLITGTLFGSGTLLFALPWMEKALRSTSPTNIPRQAYIKSARVASATQNQSNAL